VIRKKKRGTEKGNEPFWGREEGKNGDLVPTSG